MIIFLLFSLPLFTPFVLEIALLRSLFQRVIQTNLVNSSQTSCTNVQLDPCILFYPVELTTEKVHIKAALGVALWMRNIASDHGFLACNLTNLWHFSIYIYYYFSSQKDGHIRPSTQKFVQRYYIFMNYANIFRKKYFFFAFSHFSHAFMYCKIRMNSFVSFFSATPIFWHNYCCLISDTNIN